MKLLYQSLVVVPDKALTAAGEAQPVPPSLFCASGMPYGGFSCLSHRGTWFTLQERNLLETAS